MEEWLRIGASIASILTSIIAAGASVVYWANKRSRRTRLESYLRAKKEKSADEPFSVTRLIRATVSGRIWPVAPAAAVCYEARPAASQR
jgi:uncharacterized membrane protein YdjX (TVP38/TMEM64 family)